MNANQKPVVKRGEIIPLIVFVDSSRGTSLNEGVGSVFSVTDYYPPGTLPLLFLPNHTIAFFAFITLVVFLTADLATSKNLLS